MEDSWLVNQWMEPSLSLMLLVLNSCTIWKAILCLCVLLCTHPLIQGCSDDVHVHMYDAEGKTLFASMSGHARWVLSVDVSPDGAAIATGSSDKTVGLWDPKMRVAMQSMTNHTDQIWGVMFRPAGGTGVRTVQLTSVSDDEHITL